MVVSLHGKSRADPSRACPSWCRSRGLRFVGSAIIDPVALYSIQVGLTMKLHEKVALVMGSVRGLGWEMIQAFAQEGANVIICDLSQSDVDGALARLGLPLEKVLGVKADVTSEQDVIHLFRRVQEKFNRLDIRSEERRVGKECGYSSGP